MAIVKTSNQSPEPVHVLSDAAVILDEPRKQGKYVLEEYLTDTGTGVDYRVLKNVNYPTIDNVTTQVDILNGHVVDASGERIDSYSVVGPLDGSGRWYVACTAEYAMTDLGSVKGTGEVHNWIIGQVSGRVVKNKE